MTIHKGVFVVLATTVAAVFLPAAAQAMPAVNGPGAAKIVKSFVVDEKGGKKVIPLRAGGIKKGFGEVHIAKRSLHPNDVIAEGHKEALELLDTLGEKAFSAGVAKKSSSRSQYKYAVYSTDYEKQSGEMRKLCIYVGMEDFNYGYNSGKKVNYGAIGIITAYTKDGSKDC